MTNRQIGTTKKLGKYTTIQTRKLKKIRQKKGKYKKSFIGMSRNTPTYHRSNNNQGYNSYGNSSGTPKRIRYNHHSSVPSSPQLQNLNLNTTPKTSRKPTIESKISKTIGIQTKKHFLPTKMTQTSACSDESYFVDHKSKVYDCVENLWQIMKRFGGACKGETDESPNILVHEIYQQACKFFALTCINKNVIDFWISPSDFGKNSKSVYAEVIVNFIDGLLLAQDGTWFGYLIQRMEKEMHGESFTIGKWIQNFKNLSGYETLEKEVKKDSVLDNKVVNVKPNKLVSLKKTSADDEDLLESDN